jgi:hypothetical protein
MRKGELNKVGDREVRKNKKRRIILKEMVKEKVKKGT